MQSTWNSKAAGLLLLPLLPLLALPLFALPQAEDFHWGLQGRELGLFGGIAERYENWGGRLLPHGLMILPTLLADWLGLSFVWVYRALLLACLAGLIVACRWIAERLAERRPGLPAGTLALLLLYLLVAGARAPRDLLAWLPSVVTYLPAGLGALAVYLLLMQPAARGRAVAAGAAALVAGLSVEFGPLLVLGSVATAVLQRPRAWPAGLAATALSLACLAVLALAPGNEVRSVHYLQEDQFQRALAQGPLSWLEYLLQSLANPAILGALWLIACLAARAGPGAPAGRESPLWPLLLALAGGAAAISLGLWANDGMLPARAQNALLLFALPLLALSLILAVGRLGPRAVRALSGRTALAAGVVLMLLGPLPWHAWIGLADAWRFASAGQERLNELALGSPGGSGNVPALPAYPLLLTQEELSNDAGHWVNRAMARYYGFAELRLTGTGPPFPAATQPRWFAWPW